MTSTANAIENDETFWHEAYGAHGPTVLGFLRRRVRERGEAEDLLQEVFVRAIRAGTFRRDGNLRAYLLSIARNLVINRHRRPRLVVLMDRDESETEPMEDFADDGQSPEHRAEWAEFGRALAGVLDGLGDAHRRAFVLAVLEQKSYSEIARLEGWSLSQVKVNIHRARRKVLAALGDRIPSRSGRTGNGGER